MPRLLALAGLIAFAAIVALQHVLEPQLAPSRHQVSEYTNESAGALMVAGFLAWAASLVSTAILVWRTRDAWRRPIGGWIIASLLVVAAVGIVGTACFATQTSAGVLPPGVERTLGGRFHDLGSAAATLALALAAVIGIVAAPAHSALARVTAVLLGVAFAATAVLLAVGDPVDGIRQRVLLVTACIWQALLVVGVVGSRTP